MQSASDLHGESMLATAVPRRLVVCWQHPQTRAIEPVGLLSFDGTAYEFRYLARASEVEGFRLLLGFPDVERAYRSPELFPFFAQRVMDPRRPDFARHLAGLALSDDDFSPWELLARTQGRREGDTIVLYPLPRGGEDGWTCFYLVHGIRHLAAKSVPIDGETFGPYSAEELEDVLEELHAGDTLRLAPEPSNDWSPSAMLVLDPKGRPLGYLPELFSESVGLAHLDGTVRNTVERVNPPEAGWHLRILVRLESDDDRALDPLQDERFRLATAN